jgi:hypothetical protein
MLNYVLWWQLSWASEYIKFLLRLQQRTCRWTPCLLSVESREVTIIGNTWGSRGNFLGISSRAVDLTISGWPNEWINITCQRYIKSDSRYLYEYIISLIGLWHDSTDNKHGVQRQVRCCRRRRNFIYYIEYFRKAAGILLLGVWCKNIRYNIPIITLVGVWPGGLSPLEKLGHPRVTFL